MQIIKAWWAAQQGKEEAQKQKRTDINWDEINFPPIISFVHMDMDDLQKAFVIAFMFYCVMGWTNIYILGKDPAKLSEVCIALLHCIGGIGLCFYIMYRGYYGAALGGPCWLLYKLSEGLYVVIFFYLLLKSKFGMQGISFAFEEANKSPVKRDMILVTFSSLQILLGLVNAGLRALNLYDVMSSLGNSQLILKIHFKLFLQQANNMIQIKYNKLPQNKHHKKNYIKYLNSESLYVLCLFLEEKEIINLLLTNKNLKNKIENDPRIQNIVSDKIRTIRSQPLQTMYQIYYKNQKQKQEPQKINEAILENMFSRNQNILYMQLRSKIYYENQLKKIHKMIEVDKKMTELKKLRKLQDNLTNNPVYKEILKNKNQKTQEQKKDQYKQKESYDTKLQKIQRFQKKKDNQLKFLENIQQMKEDKKNDKKVVNLQSFLSISVIGKGSYAKVILVKKIDDGKFYAMKVLKKQRLVKQKQITHVLTERHILTKLTNHPFLVKMFYSFQTEKKLYFILEYCPGGELFNLLSKKRRFSEDQAKFYAAQMVLALEHLHQNNVIYRDLKPENVLINYDGYIKITDFGLSRLEVNQNEATTMCGTPEYLAPEIVQKQGYGKPADWWTLGSIIYEMVVGIPPFYTQNRAELFDKIKFQEPNYPKYISNSTKQFLQSLLHKDPSQRLGTKNGAEEIKNHPWFDRVNWQYVYEKKYEPFYIPKIKGDLGLKYFDQEFTDMTINSLEPEEGPYKKLEGFTFVTDSLVKQSESNQDNMEIENDQFNNDQIT